MALSEKNSVFALVQESTEGTPVAVSAATDYTALQEGFSITPSFEVLSSTELTGSIGLAKSVKGLEVPTATVDHYLRHSGVEGQAPDYNLLLKAGIGSEAVQATERTATTGSTVSSVVLGAGGSDYARGKAILVKHATFAHEIRNVLSVSTNTLTLAQDLANAPLTTTAMGKYVNYTPVNTGHPTLSGWWYRGNAAAGAVELMAGARVTGFTISAEAGGFINASYSLEGTGYYYNPIIITSTNKYIDFNDGGGEENAVISERTYKDPYQLAEAIAEAMNALTGDTISVTYNDSGASAGKFTLASSGGTFSLLWNTGTNAANSIGTTLGFLVAADDTGAVTYTSDNVISKVSPYTPTFDSADPLVAKDNQVLFGTSSQVSCFPASSISVTYAGDKQNIPSVCPETGVAGSVITGRTFTVQLDAILADHQAEEFKFFRKNDNVLFTWNAGEKTGTNWTPGKCINIHSPTMTINEFALTTEGSLINLSMTLQCYVTSGLNEFFINFL